MVESYDIAGTQSIRSTRLDPPFRGTGAALQLGRHPVLQGPFPLLPGQTLRLSDYEFKGRSHDGFGADWPINQADLAPYYAQAQAILSVRGCKSGLPKKHGGNYIAGSTP